MYDGKFTDNGINFQGHMSEIVEAKPMIIICSLQEVDVFKIYVQMSSRIIAPVSQKSLDWNPSVSKQIKSFPKTTTTRFALAPGPVLDPVFPGTLS